MKTRLIFLLGLAALSLPAGAAPDSGGLLAASDGKGEVRLFWFPPPGRWPLGGWQVQDGSGKVLETRIELAAPGPLAELAASDPEGAQVVSGLKETLARPLPPQDAALLYGMLGGRAMGDWNYARALGLAWMASGATAGSYRVVGLDAAGKPGGVNFAVTVPPQTATPLPAPPRDLRAEMAEGGVALFWQPPAMTRQVPVAAYRVERDGTPVPKPVIRGSRWAPGQPAWVDLNAPLERELTYRVASVDAFGRLSESVKLSLYAPDLKARVPPLAFSAEARGDRVLVRWQRSTNPHVNGYVVERAFKADGPFEALTPDGLPASADSYEDRGARAGTAYYYRLRTVTPGGAVGHPSRLAMAQPLGDGAPAAVTGFTARPLKRGVQLAWHDAAGPVAGYFVERRGETREWVRLNGKVEVVPNYLDRFPASASGRYDYRIVAIGFDSREGPASAVQSVVLADQEPPPPPRINRIDGAAGKVVIAFEPAGEASDSRQFLLLRREAGDALQPWTVLGDPLPADARRVEDDFVEAGRSYVYSLVAVDAAGNRSDPGLAAGVDVAVSELPTPPPPEVRLDPGPPAVARVRWPAAPAGLLTEIHVRPDGKGSWLLLQPASAEAGEAARANPGKSKLEFRSIYRSRSGSESSPSAVVGIAGA